ncbi:golgin subfamily B member 1-like isoform X2 [Pelobates fuscus]|uniref:golgin subfamily B member 1-like isoform X2 n=1 Tax=Pelobates fuscus TaxID=191477 RepID=UPI002FE4BC8F
MWKWYNADGTQPAGDIPDSQAHAGTMSVSDLTEQLAQTEQLVVQLKELIREKDNELRLKDQQLKEEKESSEAKVSKAKLQNKAKIASLSSQLEELKKVASPKKQEKKSEHGKASGDGEPENASANRGKILVLKRRVEELESQLSLKNEELKKKLETQRQRGSEMDAMLAEKEKKLAEKEAYIIELQISAGKSVPKETENSADNLKNQKDSANQDLQILIQNLTRKVGESEERCSLLQEQTESLKSLLNKEKKDFQEKEAMYAENIRVYQNMILEKEKDMKELSEKHEQELFKLAAKSDATADLHQLLKALKQKLHEEEEVLLGKNQVIDVLQKELDNKDQQFTEINEKYKRVQSEKENLQSKLDAEKHVMRAQLKDMMDKHETELRRLSDKHSTEIQDIQEKHEVEIQEKSQTVLQLQKQLRDLGNSKENQVEPTEVASPAVVKLKDEVKLKTEEASKSEAKFLKLKAWSKSKIRQLEEELKISETKNRDLELLKNKIFELEEDKRNMEDKLESVTELQTLNEQLLAKLVIYEEQQRKLQADLEQVTKRADSQTSESGSVDELQSQMLEWQDMNMETEPTQHHDPEEKSVLAMRMVQIEEEREAMDSGQQELEEELSTARGMGKLRQARRKVRRGSAKLQDEYEYNNKSFEDENLTLDSIESAEGENMGGWWPEYSSPNSGLRTVVEELELERNQLQEQIMGLEERCQELEDKLQLQARIESLRNENERLQTQLGQFRHQQSRESEKSQDLIMNLNEQVKGLTDRNMFLKTAIEEKDQIMREMASKLEQLKLIENTVQQKELLHKEICEKLEHSEQQREEATKKRTDSETELSALKVSNSELTEKVSAFKEMVSRQESCLQKMQLDLDQTNEELDRLNTSHLEERSQLIHDLQRCERDMDILKDVLQEKDKEMASLTASLTEYTEQISVLKDQIHFKEEQLREMADTLVKAERESHILRETQSSDMQETSAKMSSLSEQLNEINMELTNVKSLNECKTKEADELIRQISENNITIKNLRLELQAQSVTHNNHVTECSSQITSLKEQLNASVAKLDETEMKYRKEIENLKSQLEKDSSERETIAGLLEEKSNKEKCFENELKLAKEQYNKLISGISKKDEEIEKLSKEVAEQKEHCEKLNRELQTKEEHLSSLQQTSENVLRDSEEKLKTLQEKNQEFQSQLCEKNEMIHTFEAEKNELYAKYTGLERTLAARDQTLSAQLNSVEELKRKVEELENHNKGLCSQQEHVAETLHQKESEVFSLNQTLLDLQNKVTHTEKLLTDEQTTVSKLLADKDELLAKVDSISAQCVLNDSVVAAQLEEKAKECLSVKEQLIKEQELSQRMETQVRSLEKELKEAQRFVEEKDDALQAKMSECNFVCEALTQNQEKNMQLLKQVEELNRDIESRKLALHEKDVFINMQRVETEAAKNNFEKLQSEEQELREKYVNVSKNLEQLNVTIQMLQQELCHKTEENATLSTIAENRSKEIEKLRIEKDEALISLSNTKTRCESLQSQVDKTQSKAYSLKQQLDTLQLENEKLGSNLEVTSTALAKKTEEITLLSLHLSQQGHTILSLNDQIDTIRMEKQALFHSVEEKDALLFQKEELIKQTEKQLEGEGHYLQQISKLQNELQSAISERTLQQQTTEEQEAQLKKLVQEVKLYKDKSEEAELLRTQLSDHMEVISNLHSQIQNLRDNIEELNVTLTKKEDSLKEKDGSYMKLKARLAGVKNSLGQQKSQVENLISENNQYKADLLEKDGTLKNSLLAYEDLKQKFQNKEKQCETLIQQAASIEEINSRQTREINELKTLIRETETSLLNKEALIKSQLEEKIALLHSVEEKDTLLFQKEELIKQTEKRLEGEGYYLQQISKLQNELQGAISERTLQQQTTEEQEAQLKKLVQEVKLYKDKSEEAELLRTQFSDHMEVISNLHSQIQNLRDNIEELNVTLTKKEDSLKEKDGSYMKLKARLAGVKNSIKEQKGQVENLISENNQYKADLLEKDRTLKNSLLAYEDLKQKFQNKEEQCETLIQQAAFIEEINSRQTREINELKTLIRETETSLLNKEALIKSQLEEKIALLHSVEEKDTLLFQKEELIKQTEKQLEGEGNYLQQISKLQNELQSAISERTLQQQTTEEQEAQLKKLVQEVKLYKDKSEEAELLRTQLSDLKLKFQNKEEQCETLIQQAASIEELNSSQTHEINELKTLIKESETSLLNKEVLIKSQLEEKSTLVSSLQARVTELSNKLKDLEQLCTDQDNTIQNLQEKYATMYEQKRALELSLVNKEEEIAEMHKVSDEKDARLQATDHNVQALTNESNRLREELDRSATNFKNLSDALNENADSMTQSQHSVKLLKTELESLNTEYQRSLTHLRELTQEKEQKELVILNLQETCSSQSHQIENLKTEVENLNSSCLQVKSNAALQNEQLQLQCESLKCEFEKDFKALQEEKASSLSSLQKQLTEKTELVEDLKEQFAHHARESEAQMHSEALQMKNENHDLRKQVSGHVEEICALKGKIEILDRNIAELQHKSESVNEQNISLANKIQSKENALQVLIKDLRFVEEQLSVLCSESFTEYSSLDDQSEYESKLEKLSSMLCVVSNYKASMAELQLKLEEKDREIGEKSHSLLALGKERDLLQVDLQKLKAEISTRDTLMEELTPLKVANDLQRCALQEKDERLENLSMLITELQKEVALSKNEIQKKHLVLDEESRKVLELTEDAKKTDLQVQTLNVQLNHQKELITALSEQMKEKDASLMQVMESMSNEMVRFSEEKNRLHLECQNLQSSNSSFVLRIEELLENLEASKIELDLSQKTLADKENLLSTLASEKANQLEKFSKEKENLKRKLQAALAVRKDLMHKIEKLEKDKEDDLSREQHKKVELEKMVEELNCKLETMQSQNSELKSFVQLNKQELQESDVKVCELGRVITEKEAQLEELLKKVLDLQDTISQKENMCAEYSKIILEKELYITKIQNSLDQNLKCLEKESLDVLENLNSHLDITPNRVDIHPEEKVTSVPSLINNSAQVDHVNLNLKNGVGIVSKSLFQSTESVDATNKDEHPIDLEDLRSRVQEFELLKMEYADLQNIHKAKCKENEQITLQIHSLQLQTQDLEEHLLENRMQMSDKELKLEDQRQKLEDLSQEMQKMEQYENIIFELKTSVHNKDDELLHLNSQYVQLLNESRLLKDEMQKLSSELVGKHEEICGMKRVLSQLDQYKVEKETLTTEITQLQNKVEASRTEVETLERTVEKLIFENDEYLELCRVNKCEIEKLKLDIELSNIALLEKGEELATLKDLFETQRIPSEEEINLLCSKLKDSQEEGNQLQISLSQARKELEENAKNLEKAHAELLCLKTNTTRSTKEEDRLTQQANVQRLNQKSVDIGQGLPEIRAENIQSGDDHNKTVCDACSRKQVLVEELESKILQITKEKASLIEKQDKKFAEECSAKDQVQRKLQAALISRKDLLKENKSLKEKINSLNLEVDELKRSVAGICENNTSEFSALSQKYQELVSENDGLLLVNENLSAACESLKSTMETIVQEKEAFSFQLNSLKDSQTVELSGWKAKHGELNKEYESLLQAYENISDEIGKMRQVIEMIKKEKLEVLHRFHSVQAENHELEKQIHETNEETDNLRAKLKARETELQHLQMEVDGEVDLLRSGIEHKLEELSLHNQQLMEKNKELQDNFESVKLCLENKERETQNLFVKETELDNLHMELDTYKADMEIKMSELFSEKDTLNSKISELSREILEKEQSLANISKEKSELLEKLSKTEISMTEEKSILLKLERDIDSLHLEKLNLNEKVKILEDDKALLQEEIENIQEQFDKVKNEREILETELLKSRNNNSHLSEKFKSLQAQTNVLSQQVEFLRAEKNNIMRVKEEHQLQLLRELEERVKFAQDDNRGTKSKSKELQELLREKQHEINQLQKDSIIFQELIFDLEESLKESNNCLEDLKKELANTETKLTTASKDALSFREELSVKEHLLQSAMDQIESLTEQLSRFSPALGKSEMGREVAELSVTANGNQRESLDMKERSNLHRDFGENRLSIKNINSNDLNNVSKSNGLFKNVLQEGGVVLQQNQMASLLVGNVDDVENELKTIQTKLMQREEDMEKVISEQERLKASLEKQLAISRHMKEIIDNKDAEISVLLSSKDGELSNYLSQVQSQHRKQVEDYELRLSSFQIEKEKANKEYKMVDRELKRLQGEYEKAIQDKTLISNEIEAFRKSMSSLQTDRDLLCSELKDMHHHHEILLNQKDGMIISTASENNSLKQELRMALNQLDDLNAENAMLGAQLVRYREDLNQVLSMKDHQLREILRQKLDHIKNLEQEICNLRKQSREMQSNNSLLKQAADTLGAENQKLKSKVRDQETLIAAINKDKIFVESKENLSSILDEEQSGNNILQLQNGSNSQAGVKQNVYYKDTNETNAGHSETGEMSDKSSEDIYKENKELKSQNESFGKAMAALQNNRDSLIEDFKVLQWRYAGELKAEKIRGDDLERQLGDFKSHLYSILKKNSLLDETLLANESKVTCDQLTDEMESVCNRVASMVLEVNRLSSECTSYTQQIDAFSKAMASLQHDRERLLHQLQVGAIVRDVKQGTASTKVPSNVQETEYLTMDLSRSQTDTVTQVTDSLSNLTSELSKSRPKMEELERLLQEANILQEKAEREITSYQYELAELRSEKNLLAKEAQVLRQQFTVSLADRDRQIAVLRKTLNETLPLDSSHGAKNLERITVLGSATATEKVSTLSDDQGPQKNDYQQHQQSIQQKDRLIQELNAKAVEAVQMNAVLSAQLKTVSQGLRDTQMRYSDLQNQHYKLQGDLQSVRVTNQNDSRAAVPSDAPQEGANLPAQIDNPELADLQRRLANTELLYESTQRELSHLSERLLEEKTQREAAEEALTLAEQQCERLDGKTSSRDFDFSIQMDSDDEREALIIDPTQNIVLRKMRGGAVSLRRWLRGRSLYCSKLLTSRSKSRTLFLCYLLILHALVLMCLTGVL